MCSSEALYRSDFFPGLGWMLTKSMWSELSPKWPKAYPFITSHFLYCWVLSSILFSLTCNTYWDDWIRLKDVHKNRQFVRPEVCRTYNFGEHVFSCFLSFIKKFLVFLSFIIFGRVRLRFGGVLGFHRRGGGVNPNGSCGLCIYVEKYDGPKHEV